MMRRIGEAWLLVTGALAFALFVLSLLGIPWAPVPVAIGVLALLACATPLLLTIPSRPLTLSWWNLGDLVTLALIGGYTRFALAGPPTDPDFFLIWGVKGKIFFAHRGIDWAYLTWPVHNFTAHNDYPLLLPHLYSATALFNGEWSDRWLGAFNVAFGLAAMLIVRDLLAGEIAKPWRVLATAMLVPLVFSPYVGIAEGPLVAFSIPALLLIRRGETLRGALYLGLAAFTKNEGVTLTVAVAIALLLARRVKELPRLWPAITIPLPWLVLIRMHGLTNDLVAGGVLARIVERLTNPGPMLATMARHPAGSLLFWSGIVFAALLGWRSVVTRERFFAAAVAVQFLFFVAAYFVSPHDLGWHIRWSWERIVHQLMPAFVLLALLANGAMLRGTPLREKASPPGERSPDAAPSGIFPPP